jgi:thiol-disulfide isomerase/thioredoxin/Zn ribbon nucleic-acid-binding protein
MVSADFALHHWKDAAADAIKADTVATDPADKFHAEASAGKALTHPDENGVSVEQMIRAEGYLHSAMLLQPKSSSVIFLDGCALASLHRDDEAKADFNAFLAIASESHPERDRAEEFLKDPRQAVSIFGVPYDGTPEHPMVLAGVRSSGLGQTPTNLTSEPHAAYMDDPKFQKALAEAKNPRQTVEDRLDNWKHANKVAHGQCVECLHQMVVMQWHLSAFKDVVNTSRELEALTTDPVEKIFAQSQRAYALMQYNYGSPKPEQLTEADALFHQVLATRPKTRDAVFQDGRALAMLGKFDDAKAMFDHYSDMAPASDKLRARAERFADDPHLATLTMAPPFRLITSDGQEMQLDDMNGKVVLLDFWATWCGPCKETIPDIQRLARDYANDPMLVIISVSQDSDVGAWKQFIQKNNMTWPQYRDANNALGMAYGVTAIPHFFTIDTNGALKTEQIGSNADVRGVVGDLVKKAHKAEAQRAKASDKSGY